jgi:hypothetical protein
MYRNIHSGTIVLFSSRNCGTVIYKAATLYEIGAYTATWADCNNSNSLENENWERLPIGTRIELIQE